MELWALYFNDDINGNKKGKIDFPFLTTGHKSQTVTGLDVGNTWNRDVYWSIYM